MKGRALLLVLGLASTAAAQGKTEVAYDGSTPLTWGRRLGEIAKQHLKLAGILADAGDVLGLDIYENQNIAGGNPGIAKYAGKLISNEPAVAAAAVRLHTRLRRI